MLEQTTWLIWRALHSQQPDLSQQLSSVDDVSEQSSNRFQLKRYHVLATVGVILVGVVILRWIASVDWLTTLLSSGLVVGLGGIVFLILMSGTINGARWAFQIAQVIYHDIHGGRYELLSLSPLGVLGALWMITRQQSRINHVIEFFQTVSFALFLAMLLVGLIFIYTLMQGPPTLFLSQPILGSVLTIGLVILIFYLDYVQAVVIGHLSGIYLASISRSLITAEISAMAVLIAIQIATYAMALLVAFLGAILSTYLFREARDAEILLTVIMFVGTVYTFREIAIRLLWRTILTRFSVTNVEFAEFRQRSP